MCVDDERHSVLYLSSKTLGSSKEIQVGVSERLNRALPSMEC